MIDILLNALQHLSVSLSPSEFLFSLLILVVVIYFLVNLIIKNSKRISKLIGMFGGDKDEKLNKILLKINEASSKKELGETEARITALLNNISRENDKREFDLKNIIASISETKTEIEKFVDQLSSQIYTIQQQIKANDAQHELHNIKINDELKKHQDMINILTTKLEKIDDFIKLVIPEFRDFHKDLAKEVSNLNRDLLVMDRVIQAQINTNKEGVILR